MDTGGTIMLEQAGGGPPLAVKRSPKSIVIEGGFETDDPEIIARIKRDPQYGTGIKEITKEDLRAIKIREDYRKMADEKIASMKEEEVKT